MADLKNIVEIADEKAKYDEYAKQILSDKYILANIIIKAIEEFKGMKPNEVIPYIEGEPFVNIVPVNPGMTNNSTKISPKITGFNTENSELHEGLVRFDIVFYVRMPSSDGLQKELSQIILNVEAQKDEPTEYDILNRAIFYVSRLISSQKERDFIKTNYNDIQRVYSIWVCMGMEENTMCHIHLTKDDLIGYHDWRGNLNLLNIIMIGLSDTLPKHDTTYELHRLLAALFSSKLNAKQKISIINNEYDISIDSDIAKGVNIMCNLSEGIEERAMAIGEARGEARGEVRGAEKMSINIILNMYNNNFTIEQIALATQTNVDKINKIIQEHKNKI